MLIINSLNRGIFSEKKFKILMFQISMVQILNVLNSKALKLNSVRNSRHLKFEYKELENSKSVSIRKSNLKCGKI